MSRKNESVAWKVFAKIGGNKVVCRICGKQMNYQSGSSTSNMMKHLQAVHKQILAESPNPLRYNTKSANVAEIEEQSHIQKAPAAPPVRVAPVAASAVTDPYVKIQQAPADLRQHWEAIKHGLHKEMRQHQVAVAFSARYAPCLGAPAEADLLTNSQPCPQWSGSSTEQSSDWRIEEGDVTCQLAETFAVERGIKAEPIETDDVEACPSSDCASPIPLVLPSPSPPITTSTSSKSSEVSKKSVSSQTVEEDHSSSVEVELRIEGLRRAQERAEELHLEQLRESRARADAAQAERDHRLQLIRHAEELHQQQLEQAKQLHEVTMRQARHAEELSDCSESMSA